MNSLEEKVEKLHRMVEKERSRVLGYRELTKMYEAYIYILLARLEATKKKPVTITAKEISEAMIESKVIADMDKGLFRIFIDK